MEISKFTTLVELGAQLGVDGEIFALRLKSMFVDPNYQANPASHKEIKFECLSCQLNYVISVAIEPEQKPSIDILEIYPEDQMVDGQEMAETMPQANVEVLDKPIYEMQPQIQLINSINPLQCTICPHISKNKHYLRSHSKRHRNYICHYCSASIDGEDRILNHFAIKHGKGSECPICHKIFGARQNFLKHFKNHSAEKLKCKLCPFETLHPNSLKTHQILHSNEKPQHTCHICGKKSTLRGNLVEHLRNVHKLKEEKTDKSVSNFRGRERIQGSSSDTNFCSLCNRDFLTSKKLYYHNYYVHAPIKKPFLCESCGKRFIQNFDLAVHVRVHHQGRKYNCKFCEATLATPTALSRHTNSFHTKKISYECHFCSKVYYARNLIEDHLRIHTGERFKCPFCARKFIARGVFYAHKRTKHPNMK